MRWFVLSFLAACTGTGTEPEDSDPAVVDAGPDVDDDGDGVTENDGDCDDANAATSPNATETCDAGDEDCDGLVNEADPDAPVHYADRDGDGAMGTAVGCEPGEDAPTDCDDADGTIYPGAPEAFCDGVDSDCANGGLEVAAFGTRLFSTLDQAVKSAGLTETILICPGVHSGPATNKGQEFEGLTFTSYTGKAEDAVLQASSEGNILFASGVWGIHDLTIRGAEPASTSAYPCIQGAGGSSVTIARVRFENCTSGAGALRVALSDGGTLSVADSTFIGNTNAITALIENGTLTVSDTTFENNIVTRDGAVIGMTLQSGTGTFTLTDLTLTGNESSQGGNVFDITVDAGSTHLDTTIERVTLTNNTTIRGGEPVSIHGYGPGDLSLAFKDVSFVNTITTGTGALEVSALASAQVTLTDVSFEGTGVPSGTKKGGGTLKIFEIDNLDLNLTRVDLVGGITTDDVEDNCSAADIDAKAGNVTFDTVNITDNLVDDNYGCTVAFRGTGPMGITWKDVTVARNAGEDQTVVNFALEAGNTASLTNVVFGVDEDANEGIDLDSCAPDRIGTIPAAVLSALAPCPAGP